MTLFRSLVKRGLVLRGLSRRGLLARRGSRLRSGGERRGDSSESREGLDRKAREDLDEHPRHHSGGSKRRRRKRRHSHDGAERGRRRERSKHAERSRDREANCEKESQSRSSQPPTDNRIMTYCSDCGATIGGGQFGFANHCQGKYHRAAVYYWKGLPWPQAQARASKEWQRENDEYYTSCRQGQSRPPVALAERASSSARGQDRKEESRQRDAVKQQPAATKGAAPKKRSANAKASTENKDAHKKKEAQKGQEGSLVVVSVRRGNGRKFQ